MKWLQSNWRDFHRGLLVSISNQHTVFSDDTDRRNQIIKLTHDTFDADQTRGMKDALSSKS